MEVTVEVIVVAGTVEVTVWVVVVVEIVSSVNVAEAESELESSAIIEWAPSVPGGAEIVAEKAPVESVFTFVGLVV